MSVFPNETFLFLCLELYGYIDYGSFDMIKLCLVEMTVLYPMMLLYLFIRTNRSGWCPQKLFKRCSIFSKHGKSKNFYQKKRVLKNRKNQKK